MSKKNHVISWHADPVHFLVSIRPDNLGDGLQDSRYVLFSFSVLDTREFQSYSCRLPVLEGFRFCRIRKVLSLASIILCRFCGICCGFVPFFIDKAANCWIVRWLNVSLETSTCLFVRFVLCVVAWSTFHTSLMNFRSIQPIFMLVLLMLHLTLTRTTGPVNVRFIKIAEQLWFSLSLSLSLSSNDDAIHIQLLYQLWRLYSGAKKSNFPAFFKPVAWNQLLSPHYTGIERTLKKIFLFAKNM